MVQEESKHESRIENSKVNDTNKEDKPVNEQSDKDQEERKSDVPDKEN